MQKRHNLIADALELCIFCIKPLISNFEVSIVSADGLAPLGARTSAGMVLT